MTVPEPPNELTNSTGPWPSAAHVLLERREDRLLHDVGEDAEAVEDDRRRRRLGAREGQPRPHGVAEERSHEDDRDDRSPPRRGSHALLIGAGKDIALDFGDGASRPSSACARRGRSSASTSRRTSRARASRSARRRGGARLGAAHDRRRHDRRGLGSGRHRRHRAGARGLGAERAVRPRRRQFGGAFSVRGDRCFMSRAVREGKAPPRPLAGESS